MSDIKELEEQWNLYQKKRRKPYFVGVILFLMLSILGAVFYFLAQNKAYFTQETQAEKNKTEKSEVVVPQLRVKSNQFLLNPPIAGLQVRAIEEVNTSSIPAQPTATALAETGVEEIMPMIPIIDETPVERKPKKKIHKKAKRKIHKKIHRQARKERPKTPRARKHFSIVKSSSSSAYLAVEKRFNDFRDAEDSLFLAKLYYEKQEYKKSEKWALLTNKVDSTIEESWLIFAKSKINLGKTDEAIHILKNYIRQSDSHKAKVLLQKIKK